MLEVVLVISPIFTLFITFFPKSISKLCLIEGYRQIPKLVLQSWRRWIHLPVGVGSTALGAHHYKKINEDRDYPPESFIKEFQITAYRALPLRLWSRMWGSWCSCYIPKFMRSTIYGSFASAYGCNLDEMKGKLTDYPTMGEFFTRALKPGVRPIDPEDCVVSPADGRVLNSGRIHICHVEQVKGVTYNLKTFLGPPTWDKNPSGDVKHEEKVVKRVSYNRSRDENDNEISKNKTKSDDSVIPESFWSGVNVVRYLLLDKKEEETKCDESWDQYRSHMLENPDNVLYQAVVYLAPGDYHRFHSPVQWNVNFRRHFQGELMSVNPLIAGWMPGLYSLNERVVYIGKWKHGFFSMTAVGATQVGSVKVYDDPTLVTNRFKVIDNFKHKDLPMHTTWKKGQEIGEFNMGSTLVMIFEAPKTYRFNLCPEQKVKVGQPMSACKI